MKTTILFKKIDVAGQLLLAATALVILAADDYGGAAFVFGYFALGGWQLLSTLVHGLNSGAFFRSPMRRSYEKALLWIFIIGIVTAPVFLFYLMAMLVAGPIMAIYYMIVCTDEITLLRKREMVHIR